MKEKVVQVDALIVELKTFLKERTGVDIDESKIKGLAYSTLKEAGTLSREDRYKTYEHVAQMIKILNDAFGNIFEWEDVEQFTGNLFYAMRVGTRKPIEEIESLLVTYREKYGDEPRTEEMLKQLETDMIFVKDRIRRGMSETWEYIEKTQLTGVGVIVSKILKSELMKYDDKKETTKKSQKDTPQHEQSVSE